MKTLLFLVVVWQSIPSPTIPPQPIPILCTKSGGVTYCTGGGS